MLAPSHFPLQVTAHEARRVVPAAAPGPAWGVVRLETPNGTATLHTAGVHSCSGAKQLLTLQGLHEDLDGHHAVQAAAPGSSSLKIKLGAAAAGMAEELQQQVQQGRVQIRWAGSTPCDDAV